MDVSQITALIGAAASLLCTVVVGALTFFMKKTLTSLEEADKRNAEDIKALDKNLNDLISSHRSRNRATSSSTRSPEAAPRWSRRRRRGVVSLASSWMTITSSRPSGASRRCGNEPTQAARHPA